MVPNHHTDRAKTGSKDRVKKRQCSVVNRFVSSDSLLRMPLTRSVVLAEILNIRQLGWKHRVDSLFNRGPFDCRGLCHREVRLLALFEVLFGDILRANQLGSRQSLRRWLG